MFGVLFVGAELHILNIFSIWFYVFYDFYMAELFVKKVHHCIVVSMLTSK